jgi:hypothetical protein
MGLQRLIGIKEDKLEQNASMTVILGVYSLIIQLAHPVVNWPHVQLKTQ